jgi:uncharacterized protein (DUF1697 family)
LSVYISLFRGINVGGRHLVKMDALRKLHERLGFGDVRTLLQSGNVVFRTQKASASAIEEAFEKEFGFRSAVIVRTAKELEATAAACPFKPSDDKKPNWIAVAFFPEKVDARAIQALEAHDGPELVEIAKREIFVYYAAGMGRSKLPLKGECTVRNWNTVAKLVEMTGG